MSESHPPKRYHTSMGGDPLCFKMTKTTTQLQCGLDLRAREPRLFDIRVVPVTRPKGERRFHWGHKTHKGGRACLASRRTHCRDPGKGVGIGWSTFRTSNRRIRRNRLMECNHHRRWQRRQPGDGGREHRGGGENGRSEREEETSTGTAY